MGCTLFAMTNKKTVLGEPQNGIQVSTSMYPCTLCQLTFPDEWIIKSSLNTKKSVKFHFVLLHRLQHLRAKMEVVFFVIIRYSLH